MGKKSRTKSQQATAAAEQAAAGGSGQQGAVGPRQPCPCGSGRRYKACHGAAGGPAPSFVKRPFEGLRSECDVIALRELVPAATAPLPLRAQEHQDRVVTLCSILPMAAPAVVRDNGEVLLGMQVQHNYGDPARDLGAVLVAALTASEPGAVGLTTFPGEGPRIQDLVADVPLDITVHEGFSYWLEQDDPDQEALLERANQAAHPTQRLASVEAAYWTNVGTKEHLRWVMPEPEEQLLDALARLHAREADSIADGSRLVGMFRAHGLLAPVWDLPIGTGAEVLEAPAAAFLAALREALADESPLSAAERAARSGLANRQVTLR